MKERRGGEGEGAQLGKGESEGGGGSGETGISLAVGDDQECDRIVDQIIRGGVLLARENMKGAQRWERRQSNQERHKGGVILVGAKRSQWSQSSAQEIEELRPTEAAVAVEQLQYAQKIEIKTVGPPT